MKGLGPMLSLFFKELKDYLTERITGVTDSLETVHPDSLKVSQAILRTFKEIRMFADKIADKYLITEGDALSGWDDSRFNDE